MSKYITCFVLYLWRIICLLDTLTERDMCRGLWSSVEVRYLRWPKGIMRPSAFERPMYFHLLMFLKDCMQKTLMFTAPYDNRGMCDIPIQYEVMAWNAWT